LLYYLGMKKLLLISVFIMILAPVCVFAQEQSFEAKVIEIVKENTIVREDGTSVIQQDLKLQGLEGEWQGKEIESHGISDLDVVKGVVAKRGDKVVVSASIGPEGDQVFYIIDQVRRGWQYILALLFAALIIVIGKGKGVKALVSLIATFLIIMWFIIPRILAGWSPLLTSIIGAIVILAAIIYITWGFSSKAHIAIAAIVISLVLTGLIAIIFTKLTHLTGLANEDVMFLIGRGGAPINFQGLLLAGIIIGTLGVLDDVVISQISAIEQLKKANPGFTRHELFKSGLHIGIDHISSMTNTLFMAYAGASLPLLLLFSVGSEPFVTFSQVINNEMIATEIVRTLTGSIGLILAVPICTVLAVKFIKSGK